MDKIKPLAAIALAAGLLLGLGRMWMLAAENERLEARLEILAAELDRAGRELSANMEALARREDERRRLAAETDALKFKLGEIYEKDTLAADWSDALCPDSVLECLRR